MMPDPGQRQPQTDRRQKLIDATARALDKLGAGGVSVRTIAAEADVSPSLVTHHFDGVAPLIAATYEHILSSAMAVLDAAIASAGPDPKDRMLAYVAAFFRPPLLEPRQLGAWLALIGLTRSMPEVEAAHRKGYAMLLDQIAALLAACGVERDLRTHTMATHALIEGLWLQLSLDHGQIGVDEARAVAQAWILDRIR